MKIKSLVITTIIEYSISCKLIKQVSRTGLNTLIYFRMEIEIG